MDKNKKKDFIRQEIITAAKLYSDKLSGNIYRYITENDTVEVIFKNECFLHLTGVETKLSAEDFYKKASKASLHIPSSISQKIIR